MYYSYLTVTYLFINNLSHHRTISRELMNEKRLKSVKNVTDQVTSHMT